MCVFVHLHELSSARESKSTQGRKEVGGGVKEGEKGKGENEEGGRRCLYF